METFSIIYKATALFSLKNSNSTNSGAKSLLLPSPYSLKMALINQAISVGGDLDNLNSKNSSMFQIIRDIKVSYYLAPNTYFSISNSFIKILKPDRDGDGFKPTVAFREFIHVSNSIEIIIETQNIECKIYLQKYLHKINYFGKRGSFFQFISYSDTPNTANVTLFNPKSQIGGLLQEYDDFNPKATFDSINNYSPTKTKRDKHLLCIPVQLLSSSKSYSIYKIRH
jgi:hypothetical protein